MHDFDTMKTGKAVGTDTGKLLKFLKDEVIIPERFFLLSTVILVLKKKKTNVRELIRS